VEILSNIEVRWFIDDVVSIEATAAKAWFAGVPAAARREDRYLLTGRDDIGFKARIQSGTAAKLETKYLLGSLGPALLHDGFVGNVERWRKLSVDASDPALEKGGEWLKLMKARRARKFSCEGRLVKPIDAKARADAGCLIECTDLEYEVSGHKRRALTVGIDAFGPAEMLLEILLRVCETALVPAKDLHLGFECSESYPRWLARVRARCG
jgi:hypothetical protein